MSRLPFPEKSCMLQSEQRALTAGRAPRAGLLQKGRKKMSVSGSNQRPSLIISVSTMPGSAMFTRLRISSEVFTPVVLELAIRMFEIEELTKDLTEKGFILENYDKDGNLIRKANPSFKLRSDALRHLTQLLAESGMTPSAATRVRKLQKDEPTTPTGFAALD